MGHTHSWRVRDIRADADIIELACICACGETAISRENVSHPELNIRLLGPGTEITGFLDEAGEDPAPGTA